MIFNPLVAVVFCCRRVGDLGFCSDVAKKSEGGFLAPLVSKELKETVDTLLSPRLVYKRQSRIHRQQHHTPMMMASFKHNSNKNNNIEEEASMLAPKNAKLTNRM